MICASILTLAFVSSSNVYSEESYIIDVANDPQTQSVNCAINTAKANQDMSFYWDADNAQLAKYLKKYGIVADLDQLDSYDVVQEMISEDMIP